MNRPARVGALLLAAGEGSRYGGAKQLAQLAGQSLVRRAALACIDAGCELSVVTGAHAALVGADLQRLPARVVHNADWAEGMGSSIGCGMRDWLASAQPPSAMLVVLADQPLIGAAQLRRLIALHREQPEAIFVCDHGATNGPPCLFPPDCYAALAALQGPQGARPLVQARRERVRVIAMPEAAVDIDTREDFAALLQRPDMQP